MGGRLQTFTDPVTYGYATGRVRVLEDRMFSMNRLERLIETREGSERLRILAETDYGQDVTDLTPAGIEAGLEEYLQGFYSLVSELAPEAVTRFFRLAYDFHNLKVLMKGHATGQETDELWSGLGLLDVNVAREAVGAGKPDGLPYPYSDALARALAMYEEMKEPQWIDIVLDQALYKEQGAIAKSLGNPFLVRFVRLLTDLADLRVAVRALKLGRDQEFLRRAFIEGGSVSTELWLVSSRRPLSTWGETLGGHIERVLDRVLVGGDVELSTLDKAAEQYAVDFLRKARYVSVGLEPIVSYIFSKELEVKAIRLVLMAGARGVPVEAVRRKLRGLYS